LRSSFDFSSRHSTFPFTGTSEKSYGKMVYGFL
jgi:hypothetical protein